jgi:lysophospholipase L1-like esterase
LSVPLAPAGDADVAAPRTDDNSRLAHDQLVRKAKQGQIDLYFAGDSITRRWGATDYPELLAHWKKNFFGWNAANFGWGADRTQNILWRLENGELDGPQPKVVVVLAGTNNVPDVPAGGDETKEAGIARGVEAIVRHVQQKAPLAVVIVTAIFPRNDNPAYISVIGRVNARISKLADGTRVRFLDVNGKLADANGRLYDGMMHDKLHPSVRGYDVWAEGLKPILAEVLGPPAVDDRAPAPTGDPSARP